MPLAHYLTALWGGHSRRALLLLQLCIFANTYGNISLSTGKLICCRLSYHVLNGTYLASAVPENETFIPTALTDSTFTNVTGGQRVGAIRSGNNVTFYSGLLQNSSVTTAVSCFKETLNSE